MELAHFDVETLETLGGSNHAIEHDQFVDLPRNTWCFSIVIFILYYFTRYEREILLPNEWE